MTRSSSPQVNPLHPQNGHLVELVDLLLDCEPAISYNCLVLQSLCADYKDKDIGEYKMASLLIKLANSIKNYSEPKEKVKGDGVSPGALYFQITKPSRFILKTLDLKANGVPMSSLVPTSETKGWHMDNLAKVLRETFTKINVIAEVNCLVGKIGRVI
jgi:hypothetical protein